jgi:hypothetical protein
MLTLKEIAKGVFRTFFWSVVVVFVLFAVFCVFVSLLVVRMMLGGV